MAQGNPDIAPSGYVYIDLDTRRPWWVSAALVITAALIVAVLVAPWMIDWDDEATGADQTASSQAPSSLCRPDSTGLPEVSDPTVASWNRFCEWFVEPGTDNP